MRALVLRRVELAGVGTLKPTDVARKLGDGHLQPQADAQIGHELGARLVRCQNLALHATMTEAARHQDAVVAVEYLVDVGLVQLVAVDQRDLHMAAVVHARMVQRLDHRKVRIGQRRVLAHHRNARGVGHGMQRDQTLVHSAQHTT